MSKQEQLSPSRLQEIASPKIIITATFTSEPIEDSLSYWLQEMGISYGIEFAPYNQVFQELLSPTSLFVSNQNGINIVLVRLEDWKGNNMGQNSAKIEKTVQDFANALKTAILRSQSPCLVCICPPTPNNDTAFQILHERMQEQLAVEIEGVNGLYLITSQELTNLYPVEDYYDSYGDELGHIPYTPTLFSALGTMLARKIFALNSNPYKVIVLDCDQTLWNGVCGEDEVNGIKIDPPFRALQEFMIAQQQAGKLICLCSKNQPEDVFRVFEQHPDMLLKRDHLVNWRINWQAKSENLKSLATELQLGLDSFIFIDDNPIECAEVRANSPDVLTLQLPQDCHKITQFLEHIWAFEQLQTTEEDKQRTTLYQQNKQRQHLQENSLSFQDFLAQLNLEVEILPLEKEQLPRVAQLTQRTNQFNLTTIRRSETEIQKLCNLDKFEGQIVKVKDRFGDYGLVGLLLFEYQENALMVDTFLLSCRVLGRGVEHKMLAHLGNLAQEKGLKKISLVYKPTEKNQPILNFLISCDQEFRREKTGDCWFEFPSETASRVQFLPTSHLDNLETNNNKIQSNIKIKDNTVEKTSKNYSSEFFENIAQTLYSPEQILKEITSRQQKQRPELEIEFIAPRTALEKAIASLFVEVLQLEEVGINDDFFELGGDSIRGAILINKLQAKLNEIIHFVVLFDTKTVKKLAKYLEKNYSKAVTKLLKQKLTEVNEKQDRIDGAKVLQMRSLIPAFASTVDDDTIKNPPTIFILSPHRSGSTLLRVMLGGNPKLFAPPELELLGFETLGARKARFSGRDSFWREGTIRAIMEIRGYNTEEAIALMEELEADNLTIKQFYGLIQQWLGEKILVDKTPSYSIDLETLKQAERYFQNPLYIHLLRHPLGTIHSYEAARVEQTFPYEHPFNRRELAELVWLISQQNILEFLQKVPQNRQYQVKFEDLVSQTQNTVEGICQFLGLDFHPDMLQPYKDTKQRMTDGIYAQSRMIGDVKFHQHQGINQKTIDSWKDDYTTDFLGDGTWQLAETLGYSRNSLAIPKISRKTGTDSQIFPLSFAQQRLWILAQLEPDSPFYNMFKAVRLQGPINLDILEQSINEIIRRHEILRTNFREEDGIPVQIIATQATLKLSVLDLQALSAQQQSEQLQFLATQEQLQPFDLTTGLLLRVTVVQLNSESYALLLTMHHIIGDGWSMGVFFKELSSLYQCFLVGNPSTLPALPIQYADFTIWQRQWLQGAVPNQINYWKKQLGDAPPLLELPTDRPRPSVQTYRGSCFSFELDVKLTQKIKQLSHQSGTTLFMTLIAAYTTLLLRYSNQEDILVGTAIANRNHEDIEGLIGFFVNTLVVRSSLEGNPKFSEFLKQVTSTCKEAYANQDVPFEAIIDALQIERSLSHSPLFQVMFVLQNAPSEQVETPNLAIAPLSLNEVNAKFDLALQMWESKTESGDSLQGSWQYNSDLFEPSTIARMSQHFQTLLEAIVINPEQTINLLPLLTQQERYQLLEAWNDTQVDYLQDKCLHQLFEEQVKCTPDAVAVVFENQQLTYQELNSRANQLAHYLQSLGLKTDQFVGILLERSLDMIVGILGILKAGGAYVPLDVNYPQERLTYIFEDTKLDILLTKQQHLETLLAYQGTTICLDGDWPIIATEKTVNPITGVASDNLAYIIYTSGSTGKPKGVMIEHRSVVNYIQTIIQQCSLTSDDNQLQFFSICFDASVDEIFGCLSSGATLVLRTEEMLRSSEYFWHCCQAWQLTILGLSTAYWHQLVSDLTSDALQVIENIKLIIVGGEALQLSKVKQWHQITSNCSSLPKLFNGYGPTETTILSTLYEFTSVDINNVTIGRPINNAQIYILDSHLQPVPIGVPGELNIGGAGLARGYLNRPELTNEKFITNPFEEGSKLYKTGDLARYLPDGNIEYLGRIDHQVKVRGFRIELGEIETVLSQSPQIQQSVVIVREETAGDKRLVAYLVPQPEISIKIEEIRQFLKAKLPDYMVPNGFVILETLPLTPNGKIDRRALPAPEFDSRDKYVAPRTPIEEILANICSQILKVDQVGINDNFFELGGHSLLATQLISRIRQNLQTELPLRSLFATPTLAELAQQIQTLQQQELATVAPILPRDTAAKLVLSYAQQRLWFLDQFEPNSALYNIPIALRLEGNLNQTALEQSLEKIIQRHEVLHTNFITVEGEPVQIIHPQIDWSISVVNLEHLSTTEQEINYQQFINNQAIQPFNLATEPLIRATLVTLNETEHLLMICMHHVISDGWSMGVFVEELAKLYDAYTQENSSPLDPLTLQYADFALWQRNWLQGEVQEKQLAYWQQQLENAATFLPLPTDKPRPAAQTFVGSHQQFTLSPELSQKLVKLSQEQGVTLFMTLFAAFNVLLYRYSGQADILVGTPIANRNHREIEGLIGFFVNTLVLRTDLSENPSFEQLLTQVREVALGAYAHQDLPFEMLVEALQPERDISHPPLFQVMFALQNASLSTLELSGLSVSRLPLETGIAKFDLTLSMEQTCTGLTGVWEYNTDLFDSNTIGRMSGHFVTLLEGIVTNLDTPITQLPLLTAWEEKQLLVDWNNTQTDYPQDKCIHQLFEEQVKRTPNAVALVFENQQLTYEQLNQKANQIAHFLLQNYQITPDTLVGLCVERSLEMVIGILGILKAGGAYVPLDPNYPTERLSFMLEDAQVSLLLTQQGHTNKLSEYQNNFICLEDIWEEIEQHNPCNLNREVKPSNLAYIIYTSGSTGKPKGVMIEHCSVVNYIQTMIQKCSLTPEDNLLQFSSICFDVSVQEIFGCLLSGATLVLRTEEMLRSSEDFWHCCQTWQLTSLSLSTAYWHQLVSDLTLDVLEVIENIKLIMVAGEALQLSKVKQWHQITANGSSLPQLFNAYGPTEGTIITTLYNFTSVDITNVTIGRPISNAKTYILDSFLNPVPVGVPGELYIGGAGLARGYLNRPQLNQEKFIPNPFDPAINKGVKGSSKLYKTGDLVRYLPDGNIEYLGRIDNQVKLRGFRIELGEIETVLGHHPNIKTALVHLYEDTKENKSLVAYIIAKDESQPSTAELRQYLKAKLPEYMIPSFFILLEALPLTLNGKVDRRALPEPEIHSEEKYIPPRTPIEEILANIWSQILQVEQIGINDNFFELGGHSLLATQLISRIRDNFKVQLPLQDLFKASTIAELAQLIGQLQQQNSQTTVPRILPRDNNAELALSYAQQRLWFLDQFEPNSALYNIPIALHLEGNLNQTALEQSLQTIIERHEGLRTNFLTSEGQPTQIIHPQIDWSISVVNLEHLSTTEQETSYQQFINHQAIQPFNLATEPLIRATLVTLNETEHLLMICMHHVISDGWSMGVFVEELAKLYDAYTQENSSPLDPLTLQYADFALWQRNWLQGEVQEKQLAYWQQQLENAATFLPLPTDQPRPAAQTFVGSHQQFSLTPELSQKLVKLSQAQGVTLFMTLFAAFNVLLYRYSGQADILVGTPIANRNHREIEGLIGFFVNTLVLRTDLSENPSFEQLLTQVREVALGAYAHQDLPFEMLVEALQPERDISHPPLFQVMFALQNASLSTLELSGLSVSRLPLETGMAKFDLTLSMEQTSTGLTGVWEYNTDLFDSHTIGRMTDHFVTLLEGIVTNLDTPITQLPLLTAWEEKQLLVDWNNTKVNYPSDKCIHQLFEEQVKRTPNAVALVFEKQQLTYEQLNQKANQLAYFLLQNYQIQPDTLVGLCVERSLEMVIGILGILKAGGAYVPLDPDYPQERLSFMLEDSQVRVLLTQETLLESLPQHQAQLICLDKQWEEISQYSNENPDENVSPSNLAYIIYTSGSTGQPKGVMISHSNLCNHMFWMQETFPLTEQDKVLQKTPFGFDASVWEFYAPLLIGGQLVMVKPGGHQDPTYLVELIARKQINIVQFVPSLLQMLLEQDGMENCKSLKQIFCGGEVLSVTLQESLLSKLDVKLCNLYGPTETCIDATFWNCQKEMTRQVIPIGRPISNNKIYILDPFLQPVPIGVPGELNIGGAGLARGYLNRPELTNEKFITNPFEEGSKLYKTGDLARYLPDGNIEYLGRIDHQVKVRGFRIELGEIEATLSQSPQIQTSVVIVREETAGDKRLVAYLVPQPDITLKIEEIRQFLKAKLPDYMVPNGFVILETLPLTPNGKIDRRALPAPEFDSRDKYVAPRTPIEEILANICSQILKVDQVGINDNFFELGGHSLLATQLISRIRQNLQIELPLRSLFATPTLAELAQQIQTLQQQELATVAPILPRDTAAKLVLSYAQQRLWFLDQFEPNSALYNIPIALRLEGNLNQTALEQSLQTIIERHEGLRTNFLTSEGQPTQIIHPQIDWSISVVNLEHLSTTEQQTSYQQFINNQAIQPFNLATESLIRVTLITLTQTEHILIICMHHVISDGWSMGVFVEELAQLYDAYRQGNPSPLNPLTLQYADFALWQRNWLQGEVQQKQLTYWQQQLENAATFLPLPTDQPRPAAQTFVGSHQQFSLTPELSQKLVKLSQEQGVTLFMTLFAAFNVLLYRYSGQADILVGTPIANRNHREIEGLIGFFVNTLVLRTDLSENPSFEALLKQVREVALGAYAHQDLPFEMLVEALQPERDISHTPLFQVMFALQNASLSTVELTGLNVSRFPLETGMAKFDLTLSMEQTSTGLTGVWEYNTDLFDSNTIERIMGHFVTLLEGIVTHLDTPITQLPLLTAWEEKQLLVDWNNTQTDYPQDKCIHQLFEEQVKRTPNAVALVFENQQLTYEQLNQKANQLAHFLLQNYQITPDTLVGLCVERSLEMVIGILGILKAGGAYVPLDPNYPTERLKFMLEDSQVRVLLTQETLLESLPQNQAQLICLDKQWEEISQYSNENPQQNVSPSHLGYIIYTSGSTGKPKGVLVNHANVVRLFAATEDWYHFSSQDIWTLFHSYAFDFTVWEIWGALLYGGRLVIVPYLVTRSPEEFYNLLCQEKVTILNQTPSAFRQLIQVEETKADLADLGLRLVIFGGEALEINSLQPWFQRHGDKFPQLVNMYGITETTVHVTYRPLSLADLNSSASVIGRPIPDLQIYLLDSYLQPVPIGIPGEMYVGGAGVTRGYLNREELTAERFISSPFEEAGGRRQEAGVRSQESGVRRQEAEGRRQKAGGNKLYKTGDLARYLPNGELEYLGRIDHQVKIRGFRIELGEIEALLASHPQVWETVVLVREDTPGDKRLVAYLVPQPDITLKEAGVERQEAAASVTIEEIRQFLKAKLPDYMVPNGFVILETLPLTANGKIDRRALPAPEFHNEDKYVAPRTPIEEKLTNIWSQILQVEKVGINDNFFELGGHSLLVTQLVARIRDTFNIEIPLRDLFVAPTVNELAQSIEQLQQQNSAPIVPPILPRRRK